MIKCLNCNASLTPPEGIILKVCPFCKQLLEVKKRDINELSPDEKLKSLIEEFSPDVYLESYKFKSLLMDYFVHEKKLLKLLSVILLYQGEREIHRVSSFPEKDFVLERKKLLVKMTEQSLIPIETLEEGVDFLFGGLRTSKNNDTLVDKNEKKTTILANDEQNINLAPQGAVESSKGNNISPTHATSPVISTPILPTTKATQTSLLVNIPSLPNAIKFNQEKPQFFRNAQHIIIPKPYDCIPENAFRSNTKITTVEMSHDILWIQRYAFGLCNNLEKIIFSNALQTIGFAAFSCCNLQRLSFPSSLTTIENSAFYRNNSLLELIIPDSVEFVMERAFADCKNLSNVVIKSPKTKIHPTAFQGTPFGKSQNAELMEKSPTTSSLSTSATREEINHSIEETRQILERLQNQEQIQIPEGVKTIPAAMFRGNKKLQEVSIANTVTLIGEEAFKDCENLKIIDLSTSLRYVATEAFRNCSFCSINLPDSLTHIGELSFADNPMLTTLRVPNSVKKIDHFAFSNCVALKDVSMSKDGIEISKKAFLETEWFKINYPYGFLHGY